MKNTQTVKIQIIKPIDCEWQLFGKILRELQYETRQILNKSTQLAWEWEGFSSNYKLKYNEYPNTKDILNYVYIHGFAYDRLKNIFFKLNTADLAQTIKRATDKFKTDKLDILKGNKSISNYKKDQPIDVVSKNIQLTNENNRFYANLSLISNPYKKELEIKSGQFKVLLNVKDNYAKSIVNRVIDKNYKLCASQIEHYKNKWFLALVYQFDSEEKQLNKNRILGIDLGIVNAATMQIYDIEKERYDWIKYNQCVIDGKELIHFRQKVDARKRSLGKQAKHCGKGRIGHGYNTRMKPLETINGKIAKFRNTFNQQKSKYIIEYAIKNNCGVIQMENLSGYSEAQTETFLKNWSYHDLQTEIKRQAEREGIEFKLIDPRHTSQRCNQCGEIHKENRDCKTNQAKFECIICGHKDNADINAAKNIAIPNIDKIIEEQLKKQNNNMSA